MGSGPEGVLALPAAGRLPFDAALAIDAGDLGVLARRSLDCPALGLPTREVA